ncbi:ABC transporter substrate-binding protein [Paenibacillus antri]|uniref:ABC transporter substrate-binding protein n=1 Tax=Paenibacillus antri TaxID=2582848 RepID=A0A5R9GDI1_9BACL|nr:ABC transporter substrate-binding protein [Paenibacillus antri]TLS49435.1 ABC transporter substrate-binding protein [Paenibacillus antri]
MKLARTKKWGFAFAASALALAALTGCAAGGQEGQAEGGDALRKVTLVLDWTPNTNHTGLYVADAEGYYEEEGLDVDIIQPGDAGGDAVVASGEVEFGISVQENVTLARTQGFPLVSIAAVIQHNTSGFAAPASVGLKSPKDFEGKTYGGWGSPIESAMIESLMQEAGADFSKVEMLSAGNSDFFTMKENGIDFAWIFYGWTGIESELRGEPIDIVYLTDYSKKLDYYTPVVITNEKLIADDPELVEKFVRATSKGYTYAAEHPEESAKALLAAVPELNEELVVASQKWLSEKYIDDAPRWGEQKLEVWENYAAWMTEHGVMEGEFDAAKAFTNDFIPE